MMDSSSSEEISPFLMLPTEVFLYICNYLDAKFLAQSLRLVCKKFYSILGDQSVWKRRIPRNLKNTFPPLPVNEAKFNWLKACCSIEHEYNHWKNFEEKKYTEHIHRSHTYSVLLLNSGSLCVTGSSDQSISVWSVKRDQEPQVTRTYHKLNAHKGSVLGLLGKNSKLLSCSWDKLIKYWDISVGMQEVDSADCCAPVLSIATTDGSCLVAAGTIQGEIKIFDVRTKLRSCKNYMSRKSSVVAMTMFGNVLCSANEAGFITAWDMKKDITFAKINIKRKTTGNVTCFSYADNVLYAGDSEGFLHLIEPNEMKLVETYKLIHFPEVYGLKYTGGSIIAVCEDMFCVNTPTSPPQYITDLGILNQYGAFDYLNRIVATGYKRGYVKFMIPIN